MQIVQPHPKIPPICTVTSKKMMNILWYFFPEDGYFPVLERQISFCKGLLRRRQPVATVKYSTKMPPAS